jgi:8-oxo-dGTP pyrophosphatase MutT (NUDIX family)
VREVKEETGLAIDAARFRFHESRQLVGPLSVHKAHVFSVELTEEEMAALRAQEVANTTHGVAAETEVTAIRVRKLGDVFAAPFADWSTLGILAAVLR